MGNSSVKEVLSNGPALSAGAAPKSFIHEGPTDDPRKGSCYSMDSDVALGAKSSFGKQAPMIIRKHKQRAKQPAVFQRYFGAVIRRSCAISVSIGVLAVVAKIVQQSFAPNFDGGVVNQAGAVMVSSSFLINLLVSFRTSQSYTRYWDGCTAIYQVQGEWYDACSSLISFSKHSPKSAQQVDFQHLIVRLFSILFAMGLSEVTDTAQHSHNLELLDPWGIDERTLLDLKYAGCRVDLVVAWIQGLVISSMRDGSLTCPAPIMTRVFQQISNGCVALHQASVLTRIPLPQEYSLITTLLVSLSTIGNAFVLGTLFNGYSVLFVCCFLQAFFVWSLNLVANDLANPFGSDENDMDLPALQIQMNQRLHLLTKRKCKRTPMLVRSGKPYADRKETVGEVWEDLYEMESDIPGAALETSSDMYASSPKSSDTPRDDIILRPGLEDDLVGRVLTPCAEGKSRALPSLQTRLDTELVLGARSTDISDQDPEVGARGPGAWASEAPPAPPPPQREGAIPPLRDLGVGFPEHDLGGASRLSAFSQPHGLAALVADPPEPESSASRLVPGEDPRAQQTRGMRSSTWGGRGLQIPDGLPAQEIRRAT